MRLVFFDLETGGLDPAKHPIIQIAAIAVDEALEELAVFEAKIDFDMATADQEALLKNNYSREVWDRESRPAADVCDDLSNFLRRYSDVQMTSKAGKPYKVAQLIGHNADSFDGPFLQNWYKRLNQFMPAAFRVLCTYQRAMHHFHEREDLPQPENFKVGSLAAYFGVPLENAHDALADCRATIGIYRALRAANLTPVS
jgi:DNA polymerase-3 subunit epsilon